MFSSRRRSSCSRRKHSSTIKRGKWYRSAILAHNAALTSQTARVAEDHFDTAFCVSPCRRQFAGFLRSALRWHTHRHIGPAKCNIQLPHTAVGLGVSDHLSTHELIRRSQEIRLELQAEMRKSRELRHSIVVGIARLQKIRGSIEALRIATSANDAGQIDGSEGETCDNGQ
jgi:hypothetical protein